MREHILKDDISEYDRKVKKRSDAGKISIRPKKRKMMNKINSKEEEKILEVLSLMSSDKIKISVLDGLLVLKYLKEDKVVLTSIEIN